jgi:hypothetical protein
MESDFRIGQAGWRIKSAIGNRLENYISLNKEGSKMRGKRFIMGLGAAIFLIIFQGLVTAQEKIELRHPSNPLN